MRAAHRRIVTLGILAERFQAPYFPIYSFSFLVHPEISHPVSHFLPLIWVLCRTFWQFLMLLDILLCLNACSAQEKDELYEQGDTGP